LFKLEKFDIFPKSDELKPEWKYEAEKKNQFVNQFCIRNERMLTIFLYSTQQWWKSCIGPITQAFAGFGALGNFEFHLIW